MFSSEVLTIMEAAGTIECVIRAELPRKTEMTLDPRERFDSRETKKRLASLTDDQIRARRDALLYGMDDDDRAEELYAYSLLVSREVIRRHI